MLDGGYTPYEINEFTLADAELFFEEPSLRAMVAAYLGIKPKSAPPAAQSTTSIAALQAQFPDGMMRG